MKYNNKWLIDRFKKKEKLKFIYFWGHQPASDGNTSKSCFSQWWHAPFVVEGVHYRTAEHWMMAEKARLFKDEEILDQILTAASPAAVKQAGRAIKGFNSGVWDAKKFEIVVAGNYHKFSQHEDLKTFLVNTKDRVLVEASPVDAIWGIGMAEDHEHINNPDLWKGENLLGYALMEVRDKLNAQ